MLSIFLELIKFLQKPIMAFLELILIISIIWIFLSLLYYLILFLFIVTIFGFLFFLWALWSENVTPLTSHGPQLTFQMFILMTLVYGICMAMVYLWSDEEIKSVKWCDDDVMYRYVMWPPAQISIYETEGFPIWGIPSVTCIAWLDCIGSRQKLI